VLKRKYMIVVALVTVSVLLGSLLYSNLAFGASGYSGSWGAIRFVEPNETSEDQGIWKDAATFTWIPQNSTNNAIISCITYFEYKHGIVDGYVHWRIQLIGGDQGMRDFEGYDWGKSTWNYNWTAVRPLDFYIPPNQPNYTINVQVRCDPSYPIAYVRNINFIIEVADGMVPNEYYKVELPSEGVGGLYIPVDKFSLLAPYIALTLTVILAVSISVAYIKYRKKQ